jgi:N-acetylmuramoyl-L-alanine amidase
MGARTQYTVRSSALLERPSETSKEPSLLLPRDAKTHTGTPLTSGREHPKVLHERASVGARAWQEDSPHVAFISLHFDVDFLPIAYGGYPMCDPRDKQPSRLAEIIAANFAKTGLCGNRGGGIGSKRLGVLNPEHNPIPQKVLVEMATITHPGQRANIQTSRWRWRMARVLAQSLVQCRQERLI